MKRPFPWILAFVAATWFAAPARAQSVTFLGAASYRHEPGASVRVHTVRETRGKRAESPWPTRDISWFFVRADGNQANHDSISPRKKGEEFVRVVAEHVDANLFGLELRPRVESVAAGDLERFFAKKLAATPTGFEVEDAKAPVRVRRIESAKLLVRVAPNDEPDAHSGTAQSKTGQAMELRPLADPTAVPKGSVLPIKVYGPGDRQGLKVVATHLATNEVRSFVTNESGLGHFVVTEAGAWTVEVHRATQLAGDPDADWLVQGATLTFEAPEAASQEGDRK